MTVSFTADFSRVIREIDRLAHGPGADGTTFRLEGIMLQNFQQTQGDVHIITGYLKSSGHPSSSFDGEVWEGTIHYARRPGIFELARGNKPTLNHPEGGHYFFSSSYEETPQQYKDAVLGFLRGDNGF
jgi:hypothetical protein